MSMTKVGPGIPAEGMPAVKVYVDRCAGCQECVVRCPTGALSMDLDLWIAKSDDELCVGCRQCVRTCPFAAIEVAGGLVVGERAELHAHHPDELAVDITETRPTFASWADAVAEAERCLLCPDPTCMRGCPAHNDIPGFIKGLRDGKLKRAHEALRLTSSMPDICSRVCDHSAQCEGACTWTLAGGKAVAIGAIERFICDNEPVPALEPQSSEGRGLSVAVVGSGPAGVGAAWELVEASAEVTLYEKDDEPLGVLRWGIPSFTLPDHVVERPWKQLSAAGVDVRLATQIFPEDIEGLLEQHDAVLLCQGAGISRGLPVPHGDMAGVEDATAFLERGKEALAQGRRLPELESEGHHPKRVFVLGAGDTAMDVCRTARRMGAEVICLNRRDRAHARVRPDELAEAEAEGVTMRFEASISRLEEADGRLCTVWVAPTRQRRNGAPPEVLAAAAVREPADIVVSATGYKVDPGFVALVPGTAKRRKAEKIIERRWNASGIAYAGRDNKLTAIGRSSLDREMDLAAAALAFRPRVWVAGDALMGPATVVEAMSQGREAAHAIIMNRPRRPDAEPLGGPRRVLVAYESETGNTKRAGVTLALGFAARGSETQHMHLREVRPNHLAWADLIVIGTWVEGMVVAAVRPAKGTRSFLKRLPHLGGKKVVVYCTYAVSPGKALAAMRQGFEAAGATVIAEKGICQRALCTAPAQFGEELADQLWQEVDIHQACETARAMVGSDHSWDAHSVTELLWLTGAKAKVLDKMRSELVHALWEHPGDHNTSAALGLVTQTIAQAHRKLEVPSDRTAKQMRQGVRSSRGRGERRVTTNLIDTVI